MTYDEIKSLLLSITDPVLKLEMVMDIGKELPPIPKGLRGMEIFGCASRVEIYKDENGKFYGAADSAMVRGIVAILLSMKEADADFDEFQTLGLNLGSQRINGSAAMIAYLKNLC
jgi:sulfur transfer protein SufE